MPFPLIDQQEHAYRSGHQLIAASRRLPARDQDLVDRLSDMAGQLRPSETFKPYLTAYPLPSGTDYILARTWQDLEAPRSGCVRTRSLLIPMENWLTMNGIGDLLPLLRPVELDERPTAVASSPSSRPANPISDPRKVELVEALFLEPRQPIVVFGASEADAMLERIFSAVWPGLKRYFAACSFTLAPRKIEGRDFDLLFAPKSARNRFADWEGRRIETAGAKEARHRWSSQISRQIFESDQPSLLLGDELGSLRSDIKGDEGALRLSLLWNELAAKARTTPSAVLGMLDILNSRVAVRANDERLPTLIKSAARLAASGPNEVEAWQFLLALSAKLANLEREHSASLDLRRASRSLAHRAPSKALQFLQSEFASERAVPRPILAGVADGVGERHFDDEVSDIVLRLAPEISANLISQSEEFVSEVWDRCKRSPADWIPATVRSILLIERPDRPDLLRRAVSRMTDQVLAPLLGPMLEGIASTDLTDFAVELGKHTAFKISAFDEPIANAAKDTAAVRKLRSSLLSEFDGPNPDRFLLSTLDLTAADIEWLDHEVTDRTRAARLLSMLIDAAPSRTLVSVQRDVVSRDRIFNLLLDDIPKTTSQLGRLITVSDLPIDRLLGLGNAVLPHVSAEDRAKMVQDLLTRAFMEAEAGDRRVSTLLADPGMSLGPFQLVHAAIPIGAGTQRVAENITALALGPDRVREAIISVVDDFSGRLVRRNRENLGEFAYGAWASFISEAGRRDHDAQLRAALPTLSFAFGRQDLPVSALVVAAFPVVYAELLRSTGDEDFKRLPALITLPLSFFSDWDRARSARDELVDTYLYSSWPPADLLLTSIYSGIQEETLKRLARTYRGSDYITAIDGDSHRLTPPQFSEIQNCLSRYSRR